MTTTTTTTGGLADFPSTTEIQLTGTVLVLAALVAAGFVIWRLGDVLKDRFNGTVVEGVQAGTFLVLTALGLGSLAFLWQAAPRVWSALADVGVGSWELFNAALTAVLVVGAVLGTRLTKRAIHRIGRSRGSRLTRHQRQIAHHVVQLSVYAFTFLLALALWKVNVGDLLLGAGVLGVVLGLAARQTLGAVLAGFVVLFSRPFEVGDWVVVDDNEGIVSDITIVNTRIRTFDDEYVMVPNDVITGTEVVNRSRRGRLRINVDVGVDYATDPAEAIEVAEDAMRSVDDVRASPTPHAVLVGFGDSAVLLRLRFWIDDPTAPRKWRAQTAVVSAVKSAFEEAGIKIPFPQRELAGREEAGGLRVAGSPVGADRGGSEPTRDGDATGNGEAADGDRTTADSSEDGG